MPLATESKTPERAERRAQSRRLRRLAVTPTNYPTDGGVVSHHKFDRQNHRAIASLVGGLLLALSASPFNAEMNKRMDNIEERQSGDLVWPTEEELFREPPAPQECDICSLPMSNSNYSAEPGIEGSAAFALVSPLYLLSRELLPVQLLTQCRPKVLLWKADLPRMSLRELDGARETTLSILSQRILCRCPKREEKYFQARQSEERSALHTAR